MQSLSWLPPVLQGNLEKFVILQALAMTTSTLAARVVNSVIPSFNSTSSPILLTARCLRANMVSSHLRSPTLVSTRLHTGEAPPSPFLIVQTQSLKRGYCHNQTFSRDHSHDRFPRDPSPDEHLAIRNFISSHEPYCPSKVQLETLSRFHLMRPTHILTSHAFG
jgi:hypothetical protein